MNAPEIIEPKPMFNKKLSMMERNGKKFSDYRVEKRRSYLEVPSPSKVKNRATSSRQKKIRKSLSKSKAEKMKPADLKKRGSFNPHKKSVIVPEPMV